MPIFPVHASVPLIAAVASLVLAWIVYTQALDQRIGHVFSVVAITLAFWNLTFFCLYAIRDYQDALYWSKIFRTGGLFLVPAILHLCLVLPGSAISVPWRALLVVEYIFSGYLAALNAAGRIVTSLEPYTWGYYSVVVEPYRNAFAISALLTFLCALYLMVRGYLTTDEPRMRLQLKFWLLGMAIALPLGLTNLLPSYGIHFYPLGNLGSAVWVAIVGYAIVRHRLMDVEIIVAKVLSYGLGGLLVVGPAAALTIVLEKWAFGEVHYDFSACLVTILVATGLCFPRLERVVESQFRQHVFRRKFESRAALGALAGELVQILDRKRLTDVLSETVTSALGVTSCAVYLREDLRGRYELFLTHGAMIPRADYGADSTVVRLLAKDRSALLKEEMGDGAGCATEESDGTWSTYVPLVNGAELLGFMSLGKKPSLQAYTAGDLELLTEVGKGAGLALQNAKIYNEVRRSREMISRAGRLSALGTLAAGIAHEIRNPLVSIQTFFQLAPDRLGDEEFMTSFLRLAEAEVQRISSLVSELLSFAKSPSQSLESIDVNEIVDRIATLVEPQAHTQGIDLAVTCDQDLRNVMADADQIMQVLLNIVLNGVQATGRGGRVSLETRNTAYEGSWFVQIEVSDNGSGIPEQLKESIFDPFFTTKERGTGLGLPLAHQIVVESGGFIGVESVEGRGSRFVINLPAIGGANGDWVEKRSA